MPVLIVLGLLVLFVYFAPRIGDKRQYRESSGSGFLPVLIFLALAIAALLAWPQIGPVITPLFAPMLRH